MGLETTMIVKLTDFTPPKPRIIRPLQGFPGEWLTPPERGVTVGPDEPCAIFVDGRRIDFPLEVNFDAGEVMELTKEPTPNGMDERKAFVYGMVVEVRRV